MTNKGVVLIDGARTAFGDFGGGLRDVKPVELGVAAAKGALERAKVDPAMVDNVVFGNVSQASADASYLARHISLRSGVPIEASALIVGRLCASGLQAIISASQSIMFGDSSVGLAGGVESMSQGLIVVRGARWGMRLGDTHLDDFLEQSFLDTYINDKMGGTAENLVEKYHLTREQQDEYAYRSHMAAARAQSDGLLAQEIVPVEVADHRGNKTIIDRDEHIKPGTTLEKLARLKPAFRKDGTVTPGNASGINDGAAAMVVMSEEMASRLGYKPLARLVSWATAGVEPKYVGMGPVPAIKKALEKANLSIEDIDLIENNEAFAAFHLAVEKELELDRGKVNVNGGAIAIGHPLGASGARLTLTIMYELARRKSRYGIVSLCIGGGQGMAAVFENLRR